MLVWRETLGDSGIARVSPSPTASGNGSFDQADYGVWRAHHSDRYCRRQARTSSAVSAAAAMVEPALPTESGSVGKRLRSVYKSVNPSMPWKCEERVTNS